MDVIALVIAVLGIVVAIVIGSGQIYLANKMKDSETCQDNRDEKRRQDMIYSETTKFIQKYSSEGHDSEILLLPYCIAAYKYNLTYPYRREIYREFCAMTEEVQNEVLKRQGIDLRSFRCNDYYDRLLCNLKDIIKVTFPGDLDIFYDNGKYLERALIHHGAKEVPKIRCSVDADEKVICNLASEMDYAEHVTNLLTYHADEKPIKTLLYEPTSMGFPDSADEILVSYLCCVIARYVALYSEHESICENDGCALDYSGIIFMEDEFLRALHELDLHSEIES